MDEYEWSLQLMEEKLARLVSDLTEMNVSVEMSLSDHKLNRAAIINKINYIKWRMNNVVNTRRPFQETCNKISQDSTEHVLFRKGSSSDTGHS